MATSGDDSGSGGPPTSLTITPNPAMISAQVQNGVVTTTPVTFIARDQNGVALNAAWQIDRGELGTLASTGTFTANGLNAGTATVTATAGTVPATATLIVTVSAVAVGATAGSGTGPQGPDSMGNPPSGGYNGVGGTPLGAAPPTATVTLLQNNSGTNAGFTLLYPYDQTVFPRGMLPPLLQWTVPTSFHATAISLHLKENGYEFSGYYAGTNLINAPIDANAWTQATNDNTGDSLLVEVKITDGTTVYGPLSVHFVIAPSRLRGTVYYDTYDSKLNTVPDMGTVNGSDGNGAVLRIDPGAFAPTLAIPANFGKCYACHEVSADGSTLFTATNDTSDNPGAVFSLQNPSAAPLATYDSTNTPASGGMFTYGGVYPDGTMALAHSKEDYHAWGGNSDLFVAATQASSGATGFPAQAQAVTPAFSPDGLHVAFALWAANPVPMVTPNKQTLAMMDFSCGAPMSSVTCAKGGPYTFSKLRSLFVDNSTSHFVGWPSFTPDGKMVVFQRTFVACGDTSNGGSELNTRSPARAELWLADAPDPTTGATRFSAMGLCALNGYKSDCATPYISTTQGTNHGNDVQLNFEPNVTPIASGGYYWLVFTSRRLYGNVATGDPYCPVQKQAPPITCLPQTKKLWMAAIDPNPKPGTDPSHPAFYLPGQEIMAGNMRAFWVDEPCQANGKSCQTGDQCCSGYCTDNGQGALQCGTKPAGCVPEYGKCVLDGDCCGGLICIGGRCSVSPIE
jgi:hypothetical protein